MPEVLKSNFKFWILIPNVHKIKLARNFFGVVEPFDAIRGEGGSVVGNKGVLTFFFTMQHCGGIDQKFIGRCKCGNGLKK